MDDLTGLYNRHRFRKDFQDHIRDAVRSGGDQGAFMTLNLDDFKDINDGFAQNTLRRAHSTAAYAAAS
jgi:GGDEF domain-containing protein